MEEFGIRFQEFSELDSFLTVFTNSFICTDKDVSTKIAAYFQISSSEDLKLEITNIRNDIILRSHQNDKTFWNLVNKNTYPL